MSGEAASDLNEVKVTAWYAVDVHQAFSAWTVAAKIADWFGPEDYRAEVLEMEVKIGGCWRFKMILQSGVVSHHRGRYLAIEPDKRTRNTRKCPFLCGGRGLTSDFGASTPSYTSIKTGPRIWMVERHAETAAALGREAS